MLVYEWNTTAHIVVDHPTQWQALAEALTATSERPDPATGDHEYEMHYWMIDALNMGIRSGLVPFVVEFAAAQGWQVTLTDCRTRPSVSCYPHATQTFAPRPIQRWACQQMMERTRGAVDLATNFGKTYVIADHWFCAGRPMMLVLVPTKELLKQTSADLAKLMGLSDSSIGRVGDGQTDWQPVTVGITNSVVRYLTAHGGLPLPFGTLMVDEGHLQVGDMVNGIAMACDAYWRYWLSGTAKKDSSEMYLMKITGLAGPMIAQVRNKHMVDAGHSATPHINFIKFDGEYPPPGGWPHSHQEQYALLKHSDDRNRLVTSVIENATTAGLVTLCFVEHKDHQKELHQLMPWAEVVYGGGNNNSVRDKLEAGTARCVIATSAWRVGVSTPCIDHLFHAGGFKSSANLLQEFGRALRRKEDGRNRCWLSDVWDTWGTFPARWAGQRVTTIRKEGFPVNMIDSSQVAGMFNRHGVGVG